MNNQEKLQQAAILLAQALDLINNAIEDNGDHVLSFDANTGVIPAVTRAIHDTQAYADIVEDAEVMPMFKEGQLVDYLHHGIARMGRITRVTENNQGQPMNERYTIEFSGIYVQGVDGKNITPIIKEQ